ncbi:hypothetical protein RclHR1_18450005 [Rhizophagus clarus]|uniref:Uncharacterized protein n=1 Tax=Rhizophagus clarus TaxID=94130 RepID=A0A2Z6QP16_9GLOM|nr:hypothetical protein RclHR1_18450005 [Rhizophagus clarus]GES78554.1 hypothetical protein GLOIN_2v1738391 [Rhizophagus clarus]
MNSNFNNNEKILTEVLDENSKKECRECKLLEEQNRELEERIKELNIIGNTDFNITIAAIKKRHEEEIKSKDEEIKSKDEKIKSKDEEIKSKNEEITKLKQENSKYQFKLGSATTFRLSDNDKNNPVQLNEDISNIQDGLDSYVTNLRKSDVDINLKNITDLLNKYRAKKNKNTNTFTLNNLNEIDEINDDIPLIKAVLQRHVLHTILDSFSDYQRRNSRKNPPLELQFLNKAEELEKLANRLEKERIGGDVVTSACSVKIRQQSFAALGNRGFSNIQEKGLHDFIKESKERLNKEMESYRRITNPTKKEEVDKKVADLIREVVRLFYFRLKTQEPIAEFKWLDDNDEFDPAHMIEHGDEENENRPVEMCIFPLIYKCDESQPNKLQPYTKATVFIRDHYNLFNLSDKNSNSNPIQNFFGYFQKKSNK